MSTPSRNDILNLKPGDRFVLRCVSCGADVSRPVTLVPDDTPWPQEYPVPLLPAGSAMRISLKQEWPELPRIEIAVMTPDLIGLTLTENWVGCCGPDGDRPNTTCVCGRIIATAYADCWQALYTAFSNDDVSVSRVSS